MKKFVIGTTYETRSACNHDCIFSYTVLSRTAQTVRLRDKFGREKTCRINKETSAFYGAEAVYPEGRYSMAPIISADKERGWK